GMIVINSCSQHYHVQSVSTVDPTAVKMHSFEGLSWGWHYGEGRPSIPEVLHQALRLHAGMLRLGFTATDAFPGIDGGMLLTMYDGHEYLEFRFEAEGIISYSRETDNIEVQEQDHLTLEQAEAILWAYRQETWTRSGSYTFATMITANNVLHPRLSPPTGVGFPLWMPGAHSRTAGNSADISASTMR